MKQNKITKTDNYNSIPQQLADMLFANIPYSNEMDQAKRKIIAALENEYKRILNETENNPIKSEGLLFSKYSTIEDAATLAGFSVKEVQFWTDQEQIHTEKETRRLFTKIRWLIYLGVGAAITSLEGTLSVIVNWEWFGIPLVLLFLLAAFFCKQKYQQIIHSYFRNHPKLNSDAARFVKIQSDRYSKRLLNSVFLLIAAITYYLYSIFVYTVTARLKMSELIQQIYNGFYSIELVMFLLFKNMLLRRWLNTVVTNKNDSLYRTHIKKLTKISVIYWAAAVIPCFFVWKKIHTFYGFPIAGFIYLLFYAVYILTRRKEIVYRNLVINKRRVSIYLIIAILCTSYHIMSRDIWILQPYISTVSAVEYQPDQIDYNETSGVYTITTEKQDFKILQLTDIHLGGSAASSMKDYKALRACYDLIRASEPDLVIVTGDLVFPLGIMSFSFNNKTPMMQFASFMRNVGIPWAFLYGNHDTESIATSSRQQIDAMFRSVSYKTSRNFLYPYTQPDITGRSNQLIEIRNVDGSLNQAVFMLDSNDYTGEGFNQYDYIHDDQVDWYEDQIKRLNQEEEKTVSSLLFFHIPLQQYEKAAQLYEQGSKEVTYYFGENKEEGTGTVCCSNYPSRLFDTAVALGSTKAMFCGHDHYNNMSLEYQGIRLTYGMSIDYLAMPGIEEDIAQRGGTLITLHPDSSYEINQIPIKNIQRSKFVKMLDGFAR